MYSHFLEDTFVEVCTGQKFKAQAGPLEKLFFLGHDRIQ